MFFDWYIAGGDGFLIRRMSLSAVVLVVVAEGIVVFLELEVVLT